MHICAKWEVLGKTDQSYLCQSIVPHHAKRFKKNCDRSPDKRLNGFEL